MFWNKIPKGYVETVDGYIVKKSECKKIRVIKRDLIGEDIEYSQWYKKENAPKYDARVKCFLFPSRGYYFFNEEVRVKEDGTPIGYHTKEEVEKLKAEIKELKDKYELISVTTGVTGGIDCLMACDIGGDKPKKKRGRPAGSKNKKK